METLKSAGLFCLGVAAVILAWTIAQSPMLLALIVGGAIAVSGQLVSTIGRVAAVLWHDRQQAGRNGSATTHVYAGELSPGRSGQRQLPAPQREIIDLTARHEFQDVRR